MGYIQLYHNVFSILFTCGWSRLANILWKMERCLPLSSWEGLSASLYVPVSICHRQGFANITALFREPTFGFIDFSLSFHFTLNWFPLLWFPSFGLLWIWYFCISVVRSRSGFLLLWRSLSSPFSLRPCCGRLLLLLPLSCQPLHLGFFASSAFWWFF